MTKQLELWAAIAPRISLGEGRNRQISMIDTHHSPTIKSSLPPLQKGLNVRNRVLCFTRSVLFSLLGSMISHFIFSHPIISKSHTIGALHIAHCIQIITNKTTSRAITISRIISSPSSSIARLFILFYFYLPPKE